MFGQCLEDTLMWQLSSKGGIDFHQKEPVRINLRQIVQTSNKQKRNPVPPQLHAHVICIVKTEQHPAHSFLKHIAAASPATTPTAKKQLRSFADHSCRQGACCGSAPGNGANSNMLDLLMLHLHACTICGYS